MIAIVTTIALVNLRVIPRFPLPAFLPLVRFVSLMFLSPLLILPHFHEQSMTNMYVISIIRDVSQKYNKTLVAKEIRNVLY